MSEDSSLNSSPADRLNPQDPSAQTSQDDEEVSSKAERVIKEVGSTSTAFIGPALPPGLSAAETDVEESLSAFYKELEEIDAQNAASNNETAEKREQQESGVPDWGQGHRSNREMSGENRPLRSHRRRHAPYPPWRPPEGDFPDADRRSWRHHHHHPHPLNGTVKSPFQPEFFTPPPVPRSPPPMMFHDWDPPHHYPPPPRFPPPHLSHTPQGFYDEPPHHFNVPFYEDHYGRREPGFRDFESDDAWERRHHSPPPPCSRVLILMRGLPGSGKSTLARELCTGPSGLILSTDDYFDTRNGYRYDAGLLGAAHQWNQDRAYEAMREGRTPIIIDNTNIQAWEMKPYVHMALDHGYRVDFCEPNTSWKFDPCELEKRNSHGVDRGKIAQMLERFSSPVSVSIIMDSLEPQHVQRRREEEPGRSGDYDNY